MGTTTTPRDDTVEGSETSWPEARLTRPQGRPCLSAGGGKDVLGALLDAASECLDKAESSRVTGRQIAEAAGVSQAMINYYFEGKEGLLASLLERDYQSLTRKLEAFLKIIEADTENTPQTSIEAVLDLMETHFRERNGLIVLIHNEAMREGSAVNKIYVSRLASRGYTVVVRIMDALMRKGRCRTDLTPEQAAYFVCSLCTIPLVILPIFQAAFNSDLQGEAHNIRRRAVARLLEPS